jgi:formate-dependent nitrite reductase membrane component NrfD
MDNLIMILGWGSPIGIGIFLLCLAGMIFILSKADKQRKKDKNKN